jgi:hypothetical protein
MNVPSIHFEFPAFVAACLGPAITTRRAPSGTGTAARRSRAAGALRRAVIAVAMSASVAVGADPLVRDTLPDASFGVEGRSVVPIDLRPGHDVAEWAVGDGQGGLWILGRAAIAGGSNGWRYVLAATRLARDGHAAAIAVREEIAFWRDTDGPLYEVQSIAADDAGRLLLSVVACTAPSLEACTSRLLRIARDGSPDTSFDGDGELRVPITQALYGAVTAGPEGEVWLSGSEPADGSRLYRFDPAGALLGQVSTQGSYAEFAATGDGRWLALMGATDGAAAVVRLSAAGTLDRAFGVDGRALVPEPVGHCGHAAPDYRVAGIAAAPDGRAVVLAHLQQSDATLGSMLVGIAPTGAVGPPTCVEHSNPDYVGLSGSVLGIALRADGRVFAALPYVAATPGTGMGMSAFRFTAAGGLETDPGFNDGAPLALRFPDVVGDSDAFAADVVLDRGAPILIGSARVEAAGYDFAAARMQGSSRVFRAGFE